MARDLVFESDTVPRRVRHKVMPPPEQIVEIARWWGDFQPGGNLRTAHPKPIVVPSTKEADTIFDDFAEQADERLVDGKVVGSSLWARAEEKACRLALVYACSKNHEQPVIDTAAAQWACELSEYLTYRMLFLASQWVSDGVLDARQKKVLRAIREAGGRLTHNKLTRRTQWLGQKERDEIIGNLLETGQIKRDKKPSPTKKANVYILS